MANKQIQKIESFGVEGVGCGEGGCGGIATLVGRDITLIPTFKASTMSIRLPATAEQLAVLGGSRISTFPATQNPGANGFTPGDVLAAFFPCAFLLMGFGVRIASGPRLLSLAGYAVPKPADGTHNDVPAIAGPPAPGDTFFDATLSYGIDAAEACFHFAQAFSLVVILGCRFELVNEKIADIGVIGSPDGYCGFGDMLSPVWNIIAEVNDIYGERGLPYQFVPGLASSTGGDTPVLSPISPPLAEMAFGGQCLEGLYNGFYRTSCILITPTTNYQAYLEVNDDVTSQYHLQKFLSLISDQGLETIGNLWTDVLDGGSDTPIGKASVLAFKGAEMDITVEALGFDVTSTQCLEFMQTYAGTFTPQMQDFYEMNAGQFLGTAMQKLGAAGYTGVLGVDAEELKAQGKTVNASALIKGAYSRRLTA